MLQASNILLMGCNVVEGEGTGLVIATGKIQYLYNDIPIAATTLFYIPGPVTTGSICIFTSNRTRVCLITLQPNLCECMYLHAGTSNQLSKIAAAAGGEPSATSLQVEIVRFVTIIAALAITTGLITVIWWAAWLDVKHPGFMTSGSMMYAKNLYYITVLTLHAGPAGTIVTLITVAAKTS
jgi:magnesium-transporting ATPase (P-type)